MRMPKNIIKAFNTYKYLVILCIAALAFLFFFGIVSSLLSINRFDKKIAEKKFAIEEQKKLADINAILTARLPRGEAKLSVPEGVKLNKSQIETIPAMIKRIGNEHKIWISAVVPDVHSLSVDERRLSLHIAGQGKYYDFRNFILSLGKDPYMEGIYELHVERDMNSNIQRFALVLAFFI